jgi:hypothetical protein
MAKKNDKPKDNRELAKQLHSLGLHVAEMPHPIKDDEVICVVVSTKKLPKNFYKWLNNRLFP